MLVNHFEKLRSLFYFIKNADLSNIGSDKLFKVRLIIEAMRNKCVKIWPEEYQAVDEQMIPM